MSNAHWYVSEYSYCTVEKDVSYSINCFHHSWMEAEMDGPLPGHGDCYPLLPAPLVDKYWEVRPEIKAKMEFDKAEDLARDWSKGVESLESQVGRLAQYIMDEIEGEPSRPEGAIDTAIRLLQERNG